MNRRSFIKSLTLCTVGWGLVPDAAARSLNIHNPGHSESHDNHIRDYLQKMKYFNKPHKDDILIDRKTYSTFTSVVKRIQRLQEIAGHGNFQILSFDTGLKIGRKYSEVGAFTKDETDFLEMIFHTDALSYGFLGQKPLNRLTSRINNNAVYKVPYTGNYLYKGMPLETYNKINKLVGKEVILTSGIRGIMKQFLLFFNKAYKYSGNLSLASRSIAPPGYSFHGNGDFDVGKVGFGAANFTDRFATTDVYERLSDLGYLKLRYPQNNMVGVRFEPWHIQMTSV
jgi:hypothetical protein